LEAGEDFITINETVGADGKPDLYFKMDRTKLLTVGHPAVGKFLTIFFALSGSVHVKAAHRTLMKLTPDEKVLPQFKSFCNIN